MYKVVIIGGTKWFWKWVAEYILAHFEEGIQITITWKDPKRGKKSSKEMWCSYTDDNIKAVSDADVVIISTPISVTEKVIKQVAPHVKVGAVLADVTSIKKTPSACMNKYVKDGVIVIPVHPMFWPFVKNITWQVFVITAKEEVRSNKIYIYFKKFLLKQGANVLETSPDEHDEMMAIIQGLTHFCLYSFWETLRHLQLDLKYSHNFISAIYNLLIASVARYMNQNPKLYYDIHTNNPKIIEVQKKYIEVVKNIHEAIQKKDEFNFVSRIYDTVKYFGDYAQSWQKYTDKIILLLSKQLELVSKNIGQKLTFENIYTSEKISWIVKKFENNVVTLSSWKRIDINEWIISKPKIIFY